MLPSCILNAISKQFQYKAGEVRQQKQSFKNWHEMWASRPYHLVFFYMRVMWPTFHQEMLTHFSSRHVDLLFTQVCWPTFNPGTLISFSSRYADLLFIQLCWPTFNPGTLTYFSSRHADLLFIQAYWPPFHPGMLTWFHAIGRSTGLVMFMLFGD